MRKQPILVLVSNFVAVGVVAGCASSSRVPAGGIDGVFGRGNTTRTGPRR